MATIATLGPELSHASQAARQYLPEAELLLFPDSSSAIHAFENNQADLAIIPIYNTREGESKNLRLLDRIKKGFWIDNIIQPIHLSFGSLDDSHHIEIISSTSTLLKQCEEFISASFPNAVLLTVKESKQAIARIKEKNLRDHGIIEAEAMLKSQGFVIRQREVASHNRTRYAVLGPEMTVSTGYDATALVTNPLPDRVGLLYDMLGEFSRRGINIMDMQTDTDVKTQKLQFYFEVEGHIDDPEMSKIIPVLEKRIIQEPNALRVLGSYPRIDMRTKYIKSFGFIGSGDMSRWFARKLESEGYKTMISGRSTELRPEAMVAKVDVVVICVPISATTPTIREYGPLLQEGQALILLAGEAEDTINAALEATVDSVEVMLVHNLWGPKAANMKDKNAAVVRTNRSGSLCSEFEAFLYKHGAEIYQDSAAKHDLLMGVSQKLPTAISVAMAMALKDNEIDPKEIGGHSTLTSLYGILAMSRLHVQNPRTYAEIMAAKGAGRKIVDNFLENLKKVLAMAQKGEIDKLCSVIEESREYLTDDFLSMRMEQALAVDETLGQILQK
jgi:prephenate dehydratase/prephenate dehydrogenase